MAYITFNVEKLKENYRFLDKLFKDNSINWAVVSKLLCGNKDFLNQLLTLDIKQICDSRVSNLRAIKAINPNIETVYIKPPAPRAIPGVVRYADISMNTEIKTIQMLSHEAVNQNKKHKIIIMIELGELREGVMREEFMQFYSRVFNLENIEVVGIGTNLTCMYGVLPNHDKLIQLSLYEQLIEAKFNKNISLVSGGSSVTIPLIFNKLLPKAINHFRVGETLFLGTDVYNKTKFKKLHNDVFKLYAEIIEVSNKPVTPSGDMGANVEGNNFALNTENFGEYSFRAIVDLGLLDIDEHHIEPCDENISFAGASSDMLVMNLGDNKRNYKVGDFIEFKMNYMGTLRAINSRYIDKRII